jgi:hypothetical protein
MRNYWNRMALYPDAAEKITRQLEALATCERVKLIAIAALTDTQLGVLNRDRVALGQTPLVAEVVFLGRTSTTAALSKTATK